MKSCPWGADATLPFSMRHFAKSDVFFPPLVTAIFPGWFI